jgi:hypothetical protein
MTGAKDQYDNVYGIKTKEELIEFSQIFFDQRVRGFKKDMAICVEDDSRSQHAILPGLVTCISFLDLLSNQPRRGRERSDGIARPGGS